MSHRLTDKGQAPTLGTLGPDFAFECPITVYKADDAPTGKQRRIAGIVSTDNVDRQNERILQDGLNFDDFLANGWYNDNHSGATTDILGYPETVKQYQRGETLPDGSIATSDCTWVEGYLLETKKATEVWELAQALGKTHRRLGYSVEGAIEERSEGDSSTIAKAKVRNVAITNCFPGDVRVSATARGISRRVYDGPMVDLELASGHKISGTPNHPVLTQRGWVPLGELDHVNDRIGRALGKPGEIIRAGQDVKDMPPRLDEVYDAAQNSGCVHYVRTGSEGDFHGDGSNGNVDIVAATGLLPDTGETFFNEQFRQLLLTCPDARHLGLAAQGSSPTLPVADDSASTFVSGGKSISLSLLDRACSVFASIFGDNIAGDTSVSDELVHPFPRDAESGGEPIAPLAVRIPAHYFRLLRDGQRLFESVCESILSAKGLAHGGVTGPRLCGDGVGAHPVSMQPHPLREVVTFSERRSSASHAGFVADTDNAGLAHACNERNIGGALAGSIQFERIALHGVRDFSGYVYNLDSIPGWYVANGIPHRNCPVNTDSRLEILARSLNAANRMLRRGMTLTDERGSAGPAKPDRPYTGRGAGQVISEQSLAGVKKRRRKKRNLTRSEAVAFVKSRVPGISEAMARAIVAITTNPLGRGK